MGSSTDRVVTLQSAGSSVLALTLAVPDATSYDLDRARPYSNCTALAHRIVLIADV